MTDITYPARKPRRRMMHPGLIVADILEQLKIPEGMAARRIGVSVSRLRRIMAGKAPITPRIAAGVGRYFWNGPRIWIALQQSHDQSVGYLEPRRWPYLLACRQNRDEWSNRTILVIRPKVG